MFILAALPEIVFVDQNITWKRENMFRLEIQSCIKGVNWQLSVLNAFDSGCHDEISFSSFASSSFCWSILWKIFFHTLNKNRIRFIVIILTFVLKILYFTRKLNHYELLRRFIHWLNPIEGEIIYRTCVMNSSKESWGREDIRNKVCKRISSWSISTFSSS